MLAPSEQTLEESSRVLADSRIVQLIVHVHDLAESEEFYRDKLGLRVIESDDDYVKFDTGQVVLCLQRASDHGVSLASPRDDSSDTVFLVDDIAAMRAALERRGIVFARSRTYEIGAVVDFYDPNGHRLMLYQPSEHSLLRTPSGEKMRAVWRASGRGGDALIGPAAETVDATPGDLEAWGLDGKPLLYFFVFIGNTGLADNFYEAALGLRAFERTHCCNQTCPGEEKGIVKYDGGGVILSTHHMHGHHAVLDDHGHPYGAQEFEPEAAKGVAPVFYVSNLEEALEELSRRGLGVSRSDVRSCEGATASVVAPFGHLYFLYEPSAEALTGTTGDKLRQILAAEL
jgi:catechol 2,3-dioxygenase-like lactoylglutathione lyase family enzyme